jgi:hypothetical protein
MRTLPCPLVFRVKSEATLIGFLAGGGFMNVIGILVALSIFTAIFGTYCAITTASSSSDSQSWKQSKPKSPRLHFVSKEVNISSHALEPNHIVFHLQGIELPNDQAKDSPKTLGLSLSELEKCIPWVPMDSAIFISSGEGFAPTVLNRIKSLETTRDLYLIDANASKARSTVAVEA